MGDTQIKYPEYLQFLDQRSQMNSALMALLAGSQLASNTLQLTDGSEETLARIFPAVRHIERFNLRSDEARSYIDQAEGHLARVGIPYAMSVLEQYVVSAIGLARLDGMQVVDSAGNTGPDIKMVNMHEVFYATCHAQPPDSMLELFHVLRLVRNGIIHENGNYKATLDQMIPALSDKALDYWEKVTQNRQPLQIKGNNNSLLLDARHLFLAFGLVQRLARDVNRTLGKTVSKRTWAEIVVDHYESETSAPRNSSKWQRLVIGLAKFNYGPVGLSSNDLKQAAESKGYWTVPHWP